jgi:hypothetical protein
VIENRAVDWMGGQEGNLLDEVDLKAVEVGAAGMRNFRQDEKRLVEASHMGQFYRADTYHKTCTDLPEGD